MRQWLLSDAFIQGFGYMSGMATAEASGPTEVCFTASHVDNTKLSPLNNTQAASPSA